MEKKRRETVLKSKMRSLYIKTMNVIHSKQNHYCVIDSANFVWLSLLNVIQPVGETGRSHIAYAVTHALCEVVLLLFFFFARAKTSHKSRRAYRTDIVWSMILHWFVLMTILKSIYGNAKGRSYFDPGSIWDVKRKSLKKNIHRNQIHNVKERNYKIWYAYFKSLSSEWQYI